MDIHKPEQRLVTSYGHPINPAFALAEVIWILSGSRDVKPLQYFNSKIGQYSDNGSTFNAAYGHRLRVAHGHDQLDDVVRLLREDPHSRQGVLNIWHPYFDRAYRPDDTTEDSVQVPNTTKDRACNVVAELLIRNGKLEWTQVMRSNDVVWGTPNNFMQWLHVMEYVATRVGVPMGKYTHFTNSLHLYDYHVDEARNITPFDAYAELGQTSHYPMGEAGVAEHTIQSMMALIDTMSNEQSIHPSVLTASAFLDHFDGAKSEYWAEVIKLFAAWGYYKRGEDKLAAEVLWSMDDQVLAWAQARHFYYWRWHKMLDNRQLFSSNLNMLVWARSSHA